MKIHVLPRVGMELVLKDHKLSPAAAIVSITAPGDKPIILDEDRHHCYMLQMVFDDIDVAVTGYAAFSAEDADLIVSFVDKFYRKGGELLIIHCLAGVSRSAGVAAAVSKHYSGDDSYFFKHHVPNMLVYSTLLNAFNRKEHRCPEENQNGLK